MHDEVGVMGLQILVLLAGFACNHRGAEHDVAEHARLRVGGWNRPSALWSPPLELKWTLTRTTRRPLKS